MSKGGGADRRSGGRWILLALLLSVCPPDRLSAQCPDGSPPPCRPRGPVLDTAEYAILPFEHVEGREPAVLSGADCAQLLSIAFGRWTDVRLADNPRLYDALRRHGAAAPFRLRFTEGLDIASELGAGRLVMGQVWHYADTTFVRATAYDVASKRPVTREITTRIAGDVQGIAAFNALADSLVAAALRIRASGLGADVTRSLEAFLAYERGQAAIAEWDLAAAARQFRRAASLDSSFAYTYFWLGQMLLWASDSSAAAMRDRTTIARKAESLLPRLGALEGTLLLGQRAMFERRWPDACGSFREVLRADSLNFAGWFGLAACNADDPVVIRDPADSTRYVFRGSYHTAVLAYRKALLLAPSFNFTFQGRAAERLSRLLVTEGFRWREGQYNEVTYFAFPGLEADTLAYYAYSGAIAARRNTKPPTHAAALAMNRRRLIEVTAAWADAFPMEPQAHRALAYALEVRGTLVPSAGEPRSALGEVRAAQRLERMRRERARDVVDAVRILVKAGEFDAARRLGDSLLRATPSPASGTATALAGVAVLLGRPALAARLIAAEANEWGFTGPDNQPVSLPLNAASAGLGLLAYAAAGAPPESVAVFERRIEHFVDGLPASGRPAARSALLDAPAKLVFKTMGLRSAHRPFPLARDRSMAMQWALAHGDTDFVRANLDTLLDLHGVPSAEEGSADGVYEEASLFLAIGDTATAERYLDGTLENLPGVYSALLHYLPLAGALVRMMVLRADVAAAQSDTSVARKWAGAVVALWLGAESPLQPTVARMRRLAQSLQ